jgi:hypothetical protein
VSHDLPREPGRRTKRTCAPTGQSRKRQFEACMWPGVAWCSPYSWTRVSSQALRGTLTAARTGRERYRNAPKPKQCRAFLIVLWILQQGIFNTPVIESRLQGSRARHARDCRLRAESLIAEPRRVPLLWEGETCLPARSMSYVLCGLGCQTALVHEVHG